MSSAWIARGDPRGSETGITQGYWAIIGTLVQGSCRSSTGFGSGQSEPGRAGSMVLTEAGLPLPRPCTQLVLLERPVVEVAPQATPGLAQEQLADSSPFRLRVHVGWSGRHTPYLSCILAGGTELWRRRQGVGRSAAGLRTFGVTKVTRFSK